MKLTTEQRRKLDYIQKQLVDFVDELYPNQFLSETPFSRVFSEFHEIDYKLKKEGEL